MLSVDADVAELNLLTKEDLIQYYGYYISPASQTRAKLAVHLIAQGAPSSVLETAPPETKNELMLKALTKLFHAHKIDTDIQKLSSRLQNLTISSTDPAPLADAVVSYLVQDASFPEGKAREFVQKEGLTDVSSFGGAEEEHGRSSGEPVRIEDVHAFKASLQNSAGPQPVKDLSQYEDLEAKL
jgi:insulysin